MHLPRPWAHLALHSQVHDIFSHNLFLSLISLQPFCIIKYSNDVSLQPTNLVDTRLLEFHHQQWAHLAPLSLVGR